MRIIYMPYLCQGGVHAVTLMRNSFRITHVDNYYKTQGVTQELAEHIGKE